jgi:ketosteroid isomerase-like protein
MATARNAALALAASTVFLCAIGSGCAGRMAAGHMARKALTADDSAREVRHATMADAHAAFYSALNGVCTGSADGMETVWSHGTDVSDFGPDGRSHLGWNAVIEQFRKEAAMKMGGTVTCVDVRMVEGDGFGFTTCTEVGTGMVINGKPTALRFRSTNVFRKEGAGWRLVHHHTDQAAPMVAPSGSPAKP